MPPDKLTIASKAGGGQEPVTAHDARAATVHYLKSYSTMLPLVLKALPECGAPALSAVEIADEVKFGSRSTVRIILANMVKIGWATAQTIPANRGGFKNVYTRAPALVPDDVDIAKLVYGDGE